MSYNPQDPAIGQPIYGIPPYDGGYPQFNHLGQPIYGYPPLGYPGGVNQQATYGQGAAPYPQSFPAPGYVAPGGYGQPHLGQIGQGYPAQGYPGGSYPPPAYAYPEKRSSAQTLAKLTKSLSGIVVVEVAIWLIIVLGVINFILAISDDRSQKLVAALVASFMATVGALWFWRTKHTQSYLLIFASSIAGFLIAFTTYWHYPIYVPYPTQDGNIASLPLPFPIVCDVITLALLLQAIASIYLVVSGNKNLEEPKTGTLAPAEQSSSDKSQESSEQSINAQTSHQPSGYQPTVQYGNPSSATGSNAIQYEESTVGADLIEPNLTETVYPIGEEGELSENIPAGTMETIGKAAE